MKPFAIVVLFLFSLVSRSQFSDFQAGILPEMTVSTKIKESWKATVKLESMQAMVNKVDAENLASDYTYVRTDIQGFVARKLDPFKELSIGYQYRFAEEAVNSHRTIQQSSIIQKKPSYRILHRVRSDQTFVDGSVPLFRLRYRPTLELPLSGDEVDPKEYYFLMADEFIYAYQSSTSSYENRVILSIGKLISKDNKVETGLDYRADRLFESDNRKRLWLRLAWFYSI
jgi:hypothetical protein